MATQVHEINAMRTPAEVFVDVKTALDFRLRGVPMPAPAPEEQTPSEAAEAPAEEAAAEEAAAEAAEATPAPDETPAEEAAPEAAAAEEGSLPAGAKIIFVLGGPGSGAHFFSVAVVLELNIHGAAVTDRTCFVLHKIRCSNTGQHV